METIEEAKDLTYWKKNAEEDYLKVPISVLRYITELEKIMYSEEDMRKCWDASKRFERPISEGYAPNFNEFIEQFKKK